MKRDKPSPIVWSIVGAILAILGMLAAPLFMAQRDGEVDEAAVEWNEFLRSLENKPIEEKRSALDTRAAEAERDLEAIKEARALLNVYDPNGPRVEIEGSWPFFEFEPNEVSPEYMESLFHLGLVCIREARYDEAILTFKKMLQINSNFPRIYLELGEAYRFRNGDGDIGLSLNCFNIVLAREDIPDSVRENVEKIVDQLKLDLLRMDANYEWDDNVSH